MDQGSVKPVRIKYYGLFWMTKRTYLVLTVAAAIFAVVIVGFASSMRALPPFRWPWEPAPVVKGPVWWSLFYANIYTIFMVLLFLEALDILMVLRRFAQEEALQRARLSNPTKEN